MSICEKCDMPENQKEAETIEVLAKIVAQEFSGVHHTCINEPEDVDKEIARKALEYIQIMVSSKF